MLLSKKAEKSKPPPCLAIVPFVKKRPLICLFSSGQSHDPDRTDDVTVNHAKDTTMTPCPRGCCPSRLPIILPDALIPKVLSYCDAKTLCRVAVVNQTWYHVANADPLWERLCRHDFGLSALQIYPPPQPVKKLYQKAHAALRAIIWRESSLFTNSSTMGQSFSSQGYLTIPLSASSWR